MDNLIQSLDKSLDKSFGVNGHLMYSEKDVNSLLVLYNRLCRGLSRDELISLVKNVKVDIDDMNDDNIEKLKLITNLFTLCFQTRDITDGKGEKTLCHWFILELYYNGYSELVLELLEYLPVQFGSWQDLNVLGDIVLTDKIEYKNIWYSGPLDADVVCNRITNINKLIKKISKMFINQLRHDEVNENISLCSKWASREGKRYWNIGKIIALTKYPARNNAERYSSYRKWNKYIKMLSNKIDIVEKKMCNGKWADIDPGDVPAKCLLNNRRAFLNIDKTDVLRSDNKDRLICRSHFLDHIDKCKSGQVNFHGSVLHPHELVKKYISLTESDGSDQSIELKEDPIIECQWNDLINNLRETLQKGNKTMKNLFIMSDVSRSMYAENNGTRFIDACIALTLACSELQVGALRNRCLTFHMKPEWVIFKEGESLYNRVTRLYKSDWGYSTNLYSGFEKILDHIVDNDIDPDLINDMKFLIISDMQFDAASRWNNTLYENLTKMFGEAGLKSRWNKAYKLPELIFWNVNGGYKNMIDSGDKKGLNELSGFSPKLFQDFVSNVTPYESLLESLDKALFNNLKNDVINFYKLGGDMYMENIGYNEPGGEQESLEPGELEPEPDQESDIDSDDEYILV